MIELKKIKLKYLFTDIFKGRTPVYSDEINNYIIFGQRNNSKKGFVFDDAKYANEQFFKFSSNKEFLKKGDIVINSLGGGTCGRVGFFDLENTSIITDGIPYILRTNFNSKYIYYILYTKQTELENLALGATNQLSLKDADLLNFNIEIIDDSNKQSRIVEFLDAKVKIIDDLDNELTREIESLELYKKALIIESVTKGLNKEVKFTETNIPWIREIPNHWKLKRGKYFLKNLKKPIKEDDGVVTCFRDGEVTLRTNRREDGFTISTKEIGYQGIDIGDLVVHGMDGFAGAIGISDSRGKASPVLNVIDTNQNKKYIMYYLRSMAYSDVFVALSTGIRVRSTDLRWNKLIELFYPLPPIDEQDSIVKEIDYYLEKTNKIIVDKQKQIEILQRLKNSLIHECVTGKIEV